MLTLLICESTVGLYMCFFFFFYINLKIVRTVRMCGDAWMERWIGWMEDEGATAQCTRSPPPFLLLGLSVLIPFLPPTPWRPATAGAAVSADSSHQPPPPREEPHRRHWKARPPLRHLSMGLLRGQTHLPAAAAAVWPQRRLSAAAGRRRPPPHHRRSGCGTTGGETRNTACIQ